MDYQAFAHQVLPWIERATGLENKRGLPMPPVEDIGPSIARISEGSIGVYLQDHNELYINSDALRSETFLESVIVHELTHWLQNAAGILNPIEHYPTERQAYETQGKWLKEVKLVDPAEVGWKRDVIEMILLEEKEMDKIRRRMQARIDRLEAYKADREHDTDDDYSDHG